MTTLSHLIGRKKTSPFIFFPPPLTTHRLSPIMLDFHSYRVSVRVNDQDLPIYQPEYDQATKTATGWIASEEGQAFTIFCQQDESFHYTTFAGVYLDGSRKKTCNKLFGEGRDYFGHLTGVRVSPTSRRPFEFASLTTTGMRKSIQQNALFI